MRRRPLKERVFDHFFYGFCIFVIIFSFGVVVFFYLTFRTLYGYPVILYTLLIILGIVGLRLYKSFK